MANYLNIPEAQALFTDVLGKSIAQDSVYRLVKRHRISTKRFGNSLGISALSWKRYLLARTKGNVLTRAKSTYKKRGPKRKPRPKQRYYVKTGRKGHGRRWDPNSRRSLAKKRAAAKKRAETLARKRAAEDW